MKIKYLLLSVFMLALWSCETDIVNPDEVYPEPYLDIDSGVFQFVLKSGYKSCSNSNLDFV